jgi:hypothetical protein
MRIEGLFDVPSARLREGEYVPIRAQRPAGAMRYRRGRILSIR